MNTVAGDGSSVTTGPSATAGHLNAFVVWGISISYVDFYLSSKKIFDI